MPILRGNFCYYLDRNPFRLLCLQHTHTHTHTHRSSVFSEVESIFLRYVLAHSFALLCSVPLWEETSVYLSALLTSIEVVLKFC